MSNNTSSVFDNISALPNEVVKSRTDKLIGFDTKYQRIFSNLKLLLSQEGLVEWSKKYYHTELPIIHQLILIKG